MSEIASFERLSKAIIDADEEAARKAAEDAIKAGIDPVRAIKEGLAKGIAVVGDKFHRFEIYLPHVMLAADAMKAGVAVLEAKISAEKMAEIRLGRVVIGTVYGDIHDIGKNLVASMLSVAGFEVHDLGTEVMPRRFIDEAEKVGADIIAMSSLMTTTMTYQREVISYLRDMGIREKYYAVVGGGVITPEWTKAIVADGYGKVVDDAVELCTRLMKEKPPKPLREPIIIE